MLTTVDAVPALIVVDLQRGFRSLPSVHPMADVVARSAELARAFRARGFAVVLVNADGGAPGRTDAGRTSAPRPTPPADWTELMAELDPQETDLFVTKRTRGAFHATGLAEALHERGVTQVFVTGVATGSGVESTAREAYDHGFHVVPVVDAMTDLDPEAHEISVRRVFPRIGEVATTHEVLARL